MTAAVTAFLEDMICAQKNFLSREKQLMIDTFFIQ